jgi:hypothetical protein
VAVVPLVVAGCPLPNPFGHRSAAAVFGLQGIEAACLAIAGPVADRPVTIPTNQGSLS